MTILNVARVIGCRGDATDGTVTIDLQLDSGETASVKMLAPGADALRPTLHQTVLRLADQISQGQTAPGQVQLFEAQSVHMGHDAKAKKSAVIFDRGLPSETGYSLTEKLTWDLGQGLNATLQAIGGKRPRDLN